MISSVEQSSASEAGREFDVTGPEEGAGEGLVEGAGADFTTGSAAGAGAG